MKFGSVCSGIEAASVAWHPLGWQAAWLAEIEPFPSAVLAHHYPDVPNLGDMTALPELIVLGHVEAPDVFCGGTPCQAFSVAGLRKSLDDARGNLSLTFCEIANAIDISRAHDNIEPCIVFWENVPGVLNTKDNAFGCFLAGLAGEDDPLVAPGGRWSNAGAVFGPQRAVAWRVLDAQYFGVAQRRRRVFVVASSRTGFDPAAVLFEFEGVRRDSAPSRETGQRSSTSAAFSAAFSAGNSSESRGIGYVEEGSPPLRAGASGTNQVPTLITATLDASYGRLQGCSGQDATARNACASGRMDFESETFLVQQPVGFNARQDPDSWTDRTGPLDTDGGTQAVAYSTKLHNTQSNQAGKFYEDYTTSLDRSNPPPAVVTFQSSQSGVRLSDTHATLDANNGVIAPAVAHSVRLANTSSNGWGIQEEVTHTLDCTAGPAVQIAMQVRRLTPVECERLQGFPDGYTAIPWRNKPAADCPDGPRYKALGNSWAVPVVRWIGERIQAETLKGLA